MLRFSHVASCLLLALTTVGLLPVSAAGQQAESSTASALLPSSHWAVGVVRRIAALGLADSDFGWGDGSLTILAVGRALHDAPSIAQRERPELALLMRGYWHRFAEEFRATAVALDASDVGSHGMRVEGWASVGYSSATGRLYPVRSISNSREDVEGPFPRPDLSEAGVSTNLSLAVTPFLAGSISPEHRDGEWGFREAYALAGWKKVGVWGGRRIPAFSTGQGGGIVINGRAAFTGGGLVLTDPIRLPWVLRHIGAIRFETFLSRLDSNATIPKPWFFASHVSISPHPRLLIGATQAFMFGGEGVAPFTWNNFKQMFLAHGVQSAGTEYENGMASWEVRFSPPVPLIPLTLYLEWGWDDNHAAWTLFPGRVMGGQIPAIPGIPALSLGLEHAGFSKPCTGCDGCHCEYYATWYRHHLFKDGWTMDRQPIGHPLGGQGEEWLLYGTWDDPTSRYRFDARSFLRKRGPYNIYAPAREGRSVGGKISAVYRATPHTDLLFTGALEDGSAGWRESAVFAGIRLKF